MISALLSNDILTSALPNLAMNASTCTAEWSFSHMKLVKTRSRNCLGDETLDMSMKIAVEGPKGLNNEQLMLIDNKSLED